MDDAPKLGFLATIDTAAPGAGGSPQTVFRARGNRLVQHAKVAKARMSDDYGVDVTDQSSAAYKARIRRQMMRG